jgi:hypothetical protein
MEEICTICTFEQKQTSAQSSLQVIKRRQKVSLNIWCISVEKGTFEKIFKHIPLPEVGLWCLVFAK